MEFPKLSKNKTVAIDNQLPMAIEQGKLDNYYAIKRRLAKMEASVEALPYWRSMITVFAFSLSLGYVGFIFYIIATQYTRLPNLVPLTFSQSQNTWQLIDKELLIIIPSVLITLIITINKLNSSVFQFDRRLAVMINICLIAFSLLGLIGFSQVISLVLVY